jgi:hypothetical protein
VSPELLLALLQLGDDGTVVNGRRLKYIADGIPETAKAARCGVDENGTILMQIEDASFDEVVDGSIVPRLIPVIQSEVA